VVLSDFPNAIDTYTPAVDDETVVSAFVLNEPREMALRVQQKLGANSDPLTALTVEGRMKGQEAGLIRRSTPITVMFNNLALTDDASLFPVAGTGPVESFSAPLSARMIFLEFTVAVTLTHGIGNLDLPGGVDLDVEVGQVIPFEWTGTAWRLVGGIAAGSGNATSIQDVPVDATAPEDDQVLAYAAGEWVPSDLVPLLPADPPDDTQAALHSLGTGAHQAASGADTRFTNARTPTAHAATHVTVGQDEIALFTTGTRGLVPAPGGTPPGTRALFEDGTWRDPAVVSGGMSNPLVAVGDVLIGADPVTGGVATPGRLPRGTAGQVLRINPGTLVLEWVDPNALTATALHDHTNSTNGGPLTDSQVDGFLDFAAISAPATPAADRARLYTKLVGGVAHAFIRDETGAETDLGAGGGGGGGHIIEDEGTPLTARGTMNFVGPGIQATDDGTKTLVNVPFFTNTVPGVIPASGGGTVNFLRADGGWAVPPGTGGGGGGVGLGALFDVDDNYSAPPAASALTKINGGTDGTNTDEEDAAHGLVVWNLCSGNTTRGWVVGTLPAGDWEWKALLHITSRAWDQSFAGIALFETGADPKAIMHGLHHNQTTGPQVMCNKWAALTGGTTGYGGEYYVERYFSHYVWVKLAHIGASRNVEYSLDGRDWLRPRGSAGYGGDIGVTDYITPDRYGFLMMGDNGGVRQYMAVVSAEFTDL